MSYRPSPGAKDATCRSLPQPVKPNHPRRGPHLTRPFPGGVQGPQGYSVALGTPTRLARHHASRDDGVVIRSFQDSDTKRLFNREAVRRVGVDLQRVARRRLRQLDAAMALDDLRVPPGNRLEKPRGAREGHDSIRLNDRGCLCFRWSEGDAYDVEIVDHH